MAKVSGQLVLAVKLHQAGRLQDAEAAYRQILAVEPNHADAIHLVGVIAFQMGRHEIAVQYIERAISLSPHVAVFHCNLGDAYHALRRIPEAVTCYRRAVSLKPAFAEAYNKLGNALNGQRKLDEAIVCCRRALDLKPDFAEAFNNLGNSFKEQRKFDEAADCYRRALKLNLDFAEAHHNLGVVLNDQEKHGEAVACYGRALAIKPNFPEAHYNLGALHQQVGNFEGAQLCWREALRHDPLHVAAQTGLAILLRSGLPADDLAALARLASSAELTLRDRASVHFAMAHVTDALEDYVAAAGHLAIANSSNLADHRAHGHVYDRQSHDRYIAMLIEKFSIAYFDRVRGLGSDSEKPVFVFGLPRTGTTLVEQILAGHSKVFGAGELQLAGMALNSLPQIMMQQTTPLECVETIDRETAGVAARRYLDWLDALDHCALRIVDKMPDNYLNLGFLMTLFPKARFIHCRRDLRDVAVSCWMTDFRKVPWSNDVEHIAARFGAYERLMQHWRRVLPGPILDLDYEVMVAEFEGTARRLIDWCGLDWEPQCLSFHTRRDPVRTASAIQVRQPIYQHAAGRWKRYEDVLAPLFAVLVAELAKSSDRFR